MSDTTTPTIDRSVYPMPMFVTFQVTDLADEHVEGDFR
jgi:hypothetical protein